jgi:hypothetical protein
MSNSLESFSNNSPVWIFYASDAVKSESLQEINNLLDSFLGSWASHGSSLFAAYQWYHDRILVVAVKEEVHAASGCSIDKLTQTIRQIDASLHTDLLNRSKLLAKCKDGAFEAFPVSQASQWVSENGHRVDWILQGHLNTLMDWKNAGMVALQDSWLKKYLKESVRN